jgi:hypothetical protein
MWFEPHLPEIRTSRANTLVRPVCRIISASRKILVDAFQIVGSTDSHPETVLDSQFGQATAIENDTGQMPHDKQFRLDQIGSRKSFSSLAEIEAEPLTRLKASLAWLVFKSAATLDAVKAALAYLPNEDLDGASWITMGTAIKAALGEEGRQLWLDWSKSSGKSGTSGKSDTAERRWAKLRPHSIGAGSIYGWATSRVLN